MIINVKKPVFQQEDVKVSHDGENVRLEIGTNGLTFHYEDALTIAAMLRSHANTAKAKCGDERRTMRVVGTLTDARELTLVGK